MTVKELIEELQALPEDLPVYVYDIANGDGFPIDIVDPTISDRIDLNFNSETNAETQRLLSLALYYCEASLKDMEWKWFGTKTDLDYFNMDTNGTQSFDSAEELEQYLATMKDFVVELKGVVGNDQAKASV